MVQDVYTMLSIQEPNVPYIKQATNQWENMKFLQLDFNKHFTKRKD